MSKTIGYWFGKCIKVTVPYVQPFFVNSVDVFLTASINSCFHGLRLIKVRRRWDFFPGKAPRIRKFSGWIHRSFQNLRNCSSAIHTTQSSPQNRFYSIFFYTAHIHWVTTVDQKNCIFKCFTHLTDQIFFLICQIEFSLHSQIIKVFTGSSGNSNNGSL